MHVRETLAQLERWPSVDAFYAESDARRYSGEMDFGVWWLAGNLSRTTHRISAVEDTGEIYVVRLARGLRDEPPGEVFLAGRFRVGDYEDAERVLAGWDDVCGQQESLAWALERASADAGGGGRVSVVERQALRQLDAPPADVVPVAAVRPLVDRWIALFDSAEDAYRVLEAASRFTADAWRRRLSEEATAGQRRGWWSFEDLDVADVDELLVAMGATELWHTELAAWAGLRALRCEDCGKSIEPGNYRSLDLFRPQPGAPGGVIWNATAQKWIVRPKAAKAGGRRFRRYDLCRRCAGEALRLRASKNQKVGHKGRHGVLSVRDRVPPRRGGRPRLLTDDELRKLHEVYVRTGLSRNELARRLAASRSKGTVEGYNQAMLYGWRRLMLPLRPVGEQIGLSRHGTDGTKRRKWKVQCRHRLKSGRRCTQYVRREPTATGSRPAEDGLCWNHANATRELAA